MAHSGVVGWGFSHVFGHHYVRAGLCCHLSPHIEVSASIPVVPLTHSFSVCRNAYLLSIEEIILDEKCL